MWVIYCSVEKAGDAIEMVDITQSMSVVLAPKDERELVCPCRSRKIILEGEADCVTNLRKSGTPYHCVQAMLDHDVYILQAENGGYHRQGHEGVSRILLNVSCSLRALLHTVLLKSVRFIGFVRKSSEATINQQT